MKQPRRKLAALFVFAAAAIIGSSAGLTYDRKDFCQSSQPKVTIFFDITTPYDSQDKETLSEGIVGVVSHFKGGELVSLRTIGVGKEEYQKSRNNIYIVFSDMIENSELFKGAEFMDANPQATLDRVSSLGFVPDLRDADVSVFGIGRSGGAGRSPLPTNRMRNLVEFWSKYFRAAGSHDPKISPNLVE
jgi:hypothetical protein